MKPIFFIIFGLILFVALSLYSADNDIKNLAAGSRTDAGLPSASVSKREARKQEREQKKAKKKAAKNKKKNTSDTSGEQTQAKRTGYTQQQFLDLLAKFRQKVRDDEVRSILTELIDVTKDIYKFKNEHDTNSRSINKFSTYYMPTTLKLLTAYIQLENGNIKTENPEKLKNEIKQGLRDITDGFKKLLNNMHEPTVIDISVEVEALKSVMAFDGLRTDDSIDISQAKQTAAEADDIGLKL